MCFHLVCPLLQQLQLMQGTIGPNFVGHCIRLRVHVQCNIKAEWARRRSERRSNCAPAAIFLSPALTERKSKKKLSLLGLIADIFFLQETSSHHLSLVHCSIDTWDPPATNCRPPLYTVYHNWRQESVPYPRSFNWMPTIATAIVGHSSFFTYKSNQITWERHDKQVSWQFAFAFTVRYCTLIHRPYWPLLLCPPPLLKAPLYRYSV